MPRAATHPLGARASGLDLAPAMRVLEEHRQEILNQLAGPRRRAAVPPRPLGAVADHIPRLFDALVHLLQRRRADPHAAPPLDDPAVLTACARTAAWSRCRSRSRPSATARAPSP